jgi:hypothetical protein
MGSAYLKCRRMTTRLDKTLKRELTLEGRSYIVAVSPEGLKLTLKGKRKGQELRWSDLVSGDAALATALNASLGSFAANESAARVKPGPPPRKSASRAPAKSRARRARKG